MFSSNFTKFFGVLSIVLVFLPACRFWQKAESETPAPTPFVSEDLRSEIPFATKEPEIFQVEILTIVNNEANTTFVAAASGGKRRFDYNYNTKNQISILQTDKSRVVLPGKKIYAENNFAPDEFSAGDFMTTALISDKPNARFVNLGAVGNLTKYRAVFEASGNNQSEALIFVDAQTGLPVRQEFYSVAGEQKTLTMTVEMKNLKLEAPDDLFEIPKDFRSVSRQEFQTAMRSLKEK